MHVNMYICMYVCMYVDYMCLCMHALGYACLYACMLSRAYLCSVSYHKLQPTQSCAIYAISMH